MTVSQKLRQDSIVNYLLYMWQIEDLIRASGLDHEQVEAQIVSRYDLPEEEMNVVRKRYYELTDMMLEEGLRESGHLSINRIILDELEDLNRRLLANPNDIIYASLYHQILPSIVSLRQKNKTAAEANGLSAENTPDIETCLNGLYGYTLLRLKGEGVSEETQKAFSRIAGFLTLLSERYKERDRGTETSSND